MSIVNMVDAELKIDVRDDISAANITANIMPRNPILPINTKLKIML